MGAPGTAGRDKYGAWIWFGPASELYATCGAFSLEISCSSGMAGGSAFDLRGWPILPGLQGRVGPSVPLQTLPFALFPVTRHFRN
jgi:hypothetical protein